MELMPYDFSGKKVRIITSKHGVPKWVASDVCAGLGLTNPTRAISGLDDDEKSTVRLTDGDPSRNIINEAGFYRLISANHAPLAEEVVACKHTFIFKGGHKTKSLTGMSAILEKCL